MTTRDFDVVVIGAGMAGATAAAFPAYTPEYRWMDAAARAGAPRDAVTPTQGTLVPRYSGS
jgi:cation diffusion facilitator CzcD-associated flavoprotein CzcO